MYNKYFVVVVPVSGLLCRATGHGAALLYQETTLPGTVLNSITIILLYCGSIINIKQYTRLD